MKLNSKQILGRIPKWLRIFLAAVLLFLVLHLILKIAPSAKLKSFVEQQYSSRFYDSHGTLLYIMPLDNGLRKEYQALEKIPAAVVQQFIKAEDKNFYYHPGIDLLSVIRAAKQNKKAGKIVSGASTITMQLARIIWPRSSNNINLKTKVGEMFKAFYLEAKFSKKEILELYLNNVPFGYQIDGVTSAARSFFGTELNLLTKEQIQTLSLIPRRPSNYAPEKNFVYPNKCPHFIKYVINTFEKEGKHIPQDLYLSIDNQFNEKIEGLLQKKLDEYKHARIHNGAAIIIDNKSGKILAWVGNASFEDLQHGGQIDGVLVKNQPGSSMKPFLYAHALEHGFEPNSILPDIPQDFGGEQIYVPFNFNNHYNGPVRFRVALASSLNVPAVYLLYHVGVDSYLDTLSKLQFDSLKDQRQSIGLSLALGGNEVTLYEMTKAFSVFPRDGNLIDLTFYDDEEKRPLISKNQVYQHDTARIVCDILSDKNARSMGFGHSQIFDTPYPAIFKTGTSNQFQNIIALGATSEFTVGVWMGNFEGQTVIHETGSSIPASIVRIMLDDLNEIRPGSPFAQPLSYSKVQICSLSGKKPGKFCPTKTWEYINTKDVSQASTGTDFCDWHIVKENRVQIEYPSQYQHWASSENFSGSFRTGGSSLEILYPKDKATYFYDSSLSPQQQSFSVKAYGGDSTFADLYIDGVFFDRRQNLFEWYIPLTIGKHQLTVVCGKEEKSIFINVK